MAATKIAAPEIKDSNMLLAGVVKSRGREETTDEEAQKV